MSQAELLAEFTESLQAAYEEAFADLDEGQLHYRLNDQTLAIAFHAWHFLRTKDNILNFVCQDRKQPVWLRQGLNEAWGLPKVDQGTGMSREDALAIRVPSADALLAYGRDVHADVMPYLRRASEDELAIVTKVVPWGERPKGRHIMQTIVAHGNAHLGQIQAMRAIQGLPGDSM